MDRPELKSYVEKTFKRYLGGVLRKMGHGDTTSEDELRGMGRTLFGNKFLGVFAADERPPSPLEPGYMYIVNTKPRSHGGEHWMGVYGTEKSGDLLFDSFARKSIIPNWNGLVTELDKDQLDEQQDCGQRTLAFLATAYVLGDLAYWV